MRLAVSLVLGCIVAFVIGVLLLPVSPLLMITSVVACLLVSVARGRFSPRKHKDSETMTP